MMNLLRDLWRGDVSLVKTYWIYGVLVSVVLGALLNVMIRAQSVGFAFTLVWMAATVYGVFMAVAVWRSAGKYQGPKVWMVLARVMAVVSILRTILNLTGAA